MAKSLRSKWKRKMRAVKRERYEKKEVKMLNDMLAKAEASEKEIKKEEDEDEEMSTDLNESVTFIKTIPRKIAIPTRRSRRDQETKKTPATTTTASDDDDDDDEEDEDENMSVDEIERIFNKRTMRDQFGNYPSWMSKKKVRTQQKKNKRLKKKALKFKK